MNDNLPRISTFKFLWLLPILLLRIISSTPVFAGSLSRLDTSKTAAEQPLLDSVHPLPSNAASIIKLDVFGFTRGYTQIVWENIIDENKAFEIGIGIIGAGTNKELRYQNVPDRFQGLRQNQSGSYIIAGYKINHLPMFIFGKKTIDAWQGSYARPIFYYGAYKENRVAFSTTTGEFAQERPATNFMALEIEFGKEWFIAHQSVLDLYWGVGYCVDNKRYYKSYSYDQITTSSFNYANDRIGKSPGLSFSFGIKLGYVFKKKKQ